MTLATFTLTADLNDLLGAPVVDGDITIDIPGTSGSVGQIIDTATGEQFFVPKKVKPTSDGKLPADVLLPFSDSASNPTGFQWRVSGTLVVLDGRGRREHVTMAPVTFTHNAADGATAILGLKVSELLVPPTFTSTLVGLAADAQESADAADSAADRAESAAVTILAPTDDQVTYLASTEGTALHGSLTAAYARRVKVRDGYPSGVQVNRILSNRVLIGADHTATLYWLMNSAGLFQLESTDIYATHNFKSWPAGTNGATVGRAKMLTFKGKHYLMAKNTSGVPGIYRADPSAGGGPFAWSAVLKTGVTGADIIGPAFNTDGTYLFWGEYGSPSGGPSLYRTTDGTTWTTVLGPLSGSNHIHGVNIDPYNPSHVYVTIGDSTNVRHMRSTSSGDAGTWVQFGPQTATWQAVQISFDEDYVWFASDGNHNSWTAFRMDRATEQFEWASNDWHFNIAVPGGRTGRYITDLAFTNNSTTMTSTTANFTASDKGAVIRAVDSSIFDNTVIVSVTNATTIVVNTAAVGTSATTAALITGDTFYGAAYLGAVDPATGVYYCIANDGSLLGSTAGLFAITPDGRLHLLKVLPLKPDGDVFIGNGYGWCGGYRWNLLQV